MRHIIQTGVLVGLVFGLVACKKTAEPVAEAAPAAPTAIVTEDQTGVVERTGPDEQTGVVERSAPVEE